MQAATLPATTTGSQPAQRQRQPARSRRVPAADAKVVLDLHKANQTMAAQRLQLKDRNREFRNVMRMKVCSLLYLSMPLSL